MDRLTNQPCAESGGVLRFSWSSGPFGVGTFLTSTFGVAFRVSRLKAAHLPSSLGGYTTMGELTILNVLQAPLNGRACP